MVDSVTKLWDSGGFEREDAEDIDEYINDLENKNQELLQALKAVTAHLDRICTHTEDYVVIVAAEKVIKKIEGARND